AAKLSSKGDLSQFVEEVAGILGAKRRAAAKATAALDLLLEAHASHMKESSGTSPKGRVEARSKEPQFSGMPFSELMTILNNEKVDIPKELSSDKSGGETSVFSI